MTTFSSTYGSTVVAIDDYRPSSGVHSEGLNGAHVQPAAPAPTQPNSGIGHNSAGAQLMPEEGDGATSVARKKAYYIEALSDWFADRRKLTSECLTPEEIGACENRVALLLQAMAIGIASIYREELFNPQSTEGAEERVRGAFAMMGVYVLDVYLSHNDKGYSTASAERAAELLGCSKNSVARARARLVQHRILVGGRKDGHGDRWWPAISRKVASDPKASVAWLLDATSEPIKRGRPTEIYTPDAGARLDGEIYTPDAGARFPGPEKSNTPSPKSNTRMRGDETLDIRLDNLSGADAPGVCATEDLLSGGVPDQGSALTERAPTSTKGAHWKPAPSTTDIRLAFDLYLVTAERCGLAKPKKVDPWVPNIRARLRDAGGLDGWKEMLIKVEASPFLRGDRTNFRADLDWLSGPKNFEKVRSGKYDEARPESGAPTANLDPEAELQRLVASEPGKAWLAKLGPEKGMEKLRGLVANSTKGKC